MSRFLGLVLMVVTGAVAAPALVAMFTNETSALVAIGLALAVLGVLFGFLATARHYFWAMAAAVAIVASLLSRWTESESTRAERPPPSRMMITAECSLPPVVLLLFSAAGARLLRRLSPRPLDTAEE